MYKLFFHIRLCTTMNTLFIYKYTKTKFIFLSHYFERILLFQCTQTTIPVLKEKIYTHKNTHVYKRRNKCTSADFIKINFLFFCKSIYFYRSMRLQYVNMTFDFTYLQGERVLHVEISADSGCLCIYDTFEENFLKSSRLCLFTYKVLFKQSKTTLRN